MSKTKVYQFNECISRTEINRLYGKKFMEAYTKRHKVDYEYRNRYYMHCEMFAKEKVEKYLEKHPELKKTKIVYKEHILLEDSNGNPVVKKRNKDITITLFDGTTISGSQYLYNTFSDDIRKFYVANYITWYRHNRTDYDDELSDMSHEQQISWEANKDFMHGKEYYYKSDFWTVDEFQEYWSNVYEGIKCRYNEDTKRALVDKHAQDFARLGIDIKSVVNQLRN